MPFGEEGASLPPAEGEVESVVVKLTHCLPQAVGSALSLARQKQRQETEFQHNEIEQQQAALNHFVASWGR